MGKNAFEQIVLMIRLSQIKKDTQVIKSTEIRCREHKCHIEVPTSIISLLLLAEPLKARQTRIGLVKALLILFRDPR